MTDTDKQWELVLHHEEERVREIAARAVREPELRALFPYASLRNLRFSTRTMFPYDALPYVRTSDEGYQVRAANHEILASGDLDTLMSILVEAIRTHLAGTK